MTRSRFGYIDDILCGVEATPDRVEIARALLKDEYTKSIDTVLAPKEEHALCIETLDVLGTSLMIAGLEFICGDSDVGHEKLLAAIALIDSMNKEIKKWK